ncbi:nagb/rpia/CoA transferase-like protein [Phialemonium atrogriseum]|uniref:Nagb/rpia/CoA transferase-like protein n=1 Tax=Phialemonium atrogriseum TaxID=1093897 RepID=A0AAJ0C8A8_9PEZI|nr:nagb/rpia/CoA transferase-like protein [Phialemonium atrogriseum]KAK1772013.1 nagb/rpia/CoA transferase-like protein [Phialemonium atrogriseum]
MATDNKPLTKRSVVSSFIFKYDNGKPLVALFRRSDKVNTYQHHLAPISGSIDKEDATPLAAAWRELHEETTLTPSSLALLRQGKPFFFADLSAGREWTVHPFAFLLLAGEDAIHTDWEHEGWGWHDPLEVEDSDQFGGVPRLAESLRRVWVERDLGGDAGGVLAAGLERLRGDYQSGARELAGDALRILRDVIAKLDTRGTSEAWWARVRFAAWHVWKNGRESMGAAIMSVLLSALRSIEDTLKEHGIRPDSEVSTACKDTVLEALGRQIAAREKASSRLVSQALAAYLEANFSSRLASQEPISILTLSESSTISHSLRHLVVESGFSLDLRVLESRPLFEGVSLAGSFADDLVSARASLQGQGGAERTRKVSITLYSDAAAVLASRGVDVVLIGADRIASTGAVSNKTGSLPAILSARHVTGGRGAPAKVIVLGESDKVAPPGSPEEHVVEENDPAQLVRAWNADYNSSRVRKGAQVIAKLLKERETRTETETENPEEGGPDSSDGVEVAVRNIFFEWCPGELIDIYMTEFGQWTAKDIAAHSEHLGAEQERLFSDL